MKHVLITGGAGFLGSHLAELLIKRGQRVTVLDNESTGKHENLAAVRDHFDFHYVRGDVEDRTVLKKLLLAADEVYHLAATLGVSRLAQAPADMINKNLTPLQILLDELRQLRDEHHTVQLFLASSCDVYGCNPETLWSEEYDLVLGPSNQPRWAFAAEQVLAEFLTLAMSKEHGLPVIIGRLFPVVGPRQSTHTGMVLPRFISNALSGKPPVVYDDGQQERSFTHVSDAVRAMADLMETSSAVGQVFNIGSEQRITILQLAERIVAAVDPQLDIEFESYRSVYDEDFTDVRRALPDLAKLKRMINFEPEFDLDNAIQDVLDWRRTQAKQVR